MYILTTLGVGGAESQVIRLAERMAGLGHAVAIVSLIHAEEELPVKLPVLRLNLAKTPMGMMRGLRFARNFLTLFRPEIVHSHTYPANIFARFLSLPWTLKGTRPRVVNTIHNVYEGDWQRGLLDAVTRRSVYAITAVSDAVADAYAGRRGGLRRRVRVITNGIEMAEFTPDRNRRRSVRAAMKARDAFVWIAVGRIAPAKDYPNLVKAWGRVLHANAVGRAEGLGASAASPVELWIAGDGDVTQWLQQTGGDGARDEAEMQIRWLGLRRDVAGLLDAADGFVLASAWEGMPLVVGEAMAMQKAIVATRAGGVGELVGDAGMLVATHDSDALAEQMLGVMRMSDKIRMAMGVAARERIAMLFSMEAKAMEWEAFYLQVIEASARRAQ